MWSPVPMTCSPPRLTGIVVVGMGDDKNWRSLNCWKTLGIKVRRVADWGGTVGGTPDGAGSGETVLRGETNVTGGESNVAVGEAGAVGAVGAGGCCVQATSATPESRTTTRIQKTEAKREWIIRAILHHSASPARAASGGRGAGGQSGGRVADNQRGIGAQKLTEL